MQWTVFASLYAISAAPLIAAMDALAAACSAWIVPNLRDALLVYFPGRLALAAIRRDPRPVSEWELPIIAGAIALLLVSTGTGYTTYIRETVLNGLGRELAAAISGAGRVAITAELFDELWGRAWVAGLAVFRNLPWSSRVALAPLVILYWAVALGSVFFAYVIWWAADVFTAVLVGIGPLFCGLWVFPWTRFLFFGWAGTTLASVVLKLLVVALMSMVLGALTALLGTLVAMSNGNNEFAQLQQLFGGVVLFLTCGWVAYQLPGIASAITKGFASSAYLPVSLPSSGGNEPAGGGSPASSVPAQQAPSGFNGGGVARHQPPGRALSGP